VVAVTARARELRAIAIAKLPTSRAGLAGVVRSDKGHSNALLQGFVCDKLLELSKRPGLVDISLPLSNPCSLSDMLKVFHDKDVISSGALNYPLADNMVKVADYPAFLTREPLQEPLGSPGAFSLKRSPQIRKMPPYMHSLLSREPETVGSSGKIVETEVYANGPCALGSGNWLGEDDIDIEPSLPSRLAIDQSSRGRLLTLKQMPLVVSQNKRNLYSAFNSGKGNHLSGRDVAKYPLVVGYRSWFKMPDFSQFSFRGLSNSGDSPYSQIGSKLVSLFKVIVAKVLKPNFIGCLVLFGYLQNIIASLGKALKSSPECLNLFWGSIQFTRDCFNKLHTNIKYITKGKSFQGRGYAPIPPPPKGGGFLGAIL